jgi:hypothetical protein
VRRLFALLRVESRASLALAALLSVPLYLAALLAASLALDRPRLVNGIHEHPPAGGTEAKVWAAALIVPAILLGVGAAALLVRRYGVYLSALAGVAVCFAIPPVAHGWIGRHERRFPIGMDFVKDSSPSNLSSRGDWEHAAYDTIVSITHWTLVLAFGAIVVGVILEIRRRRGTDVIAVPPPPLGTATGGAPEVTGPS